MLTALLRHFPELIKIVSDNTSYIKTVTCIGNKATLFNDKIHEIAAIVGDDKGIAQSIIDAAKVSMGRDISSPDLEQMESFSLRTLKLVESRKRLQEYLSSKMGVVAPNLAALIGDTIGARLISKAGSLRNLAKCPASTVQILGAEKALFRAFKMKTNTPKHGLLYHSTFIGRVAPRKKGRIARFLANKCSIASRMDAFAEAPTAEFGEALRKEVEERIAFYSDGVAPAKNENVMQCHGKSWNALTCRSMR